jgi:hypothetical protein
MSALLPKAGIHDCQQYVRFVPKAGIDLAPTVEAKAPGNAGGYFSCSPG